MIRYQMFQKQSDDKYTLYDAICVSLEAANEPNGFGCNGKLRWRNANGCTVYVYNARMSGAKMSKFQKESRYLQVIRMQMMFHSTEIKEKL